MRLCVNCSFNSPCNCGAGTQPNVACTCTCDVCVCVYMYACLYMHLWVACHLFSYPMSTNSPSHTPPYTPASSNKMHDTLESPNRFSVLASDLHDDILHGASPPLSRRGSNASSCSVPSFHSLDSFHSAVSRRSEYARLTPAVSRTDNTPADTGIPHAQQSRPPAAGRSDSGQGARAARAAN